MRILCLGDTHSDIQAITLAIEAALRNNCTRIFQVGDFGYLPHTSEGVAFLSAASHAADHVGIPIYFIDGNHDRQIDLWAPDPGVIRDAIGAYRMLPSLWYVPRGTVWEWEGARFAACGGAYSLDKQYRLHQEKQSGPYTWWWPEETIKYEDYMQLAENLHHEPVDIFFSHDKPEHATLDASWRPLFNGISYPSQINQEYLQRAVDLAQPRVLIHGHFHHAYDTSLDRPRYHTKVWGLHCNGTGPRNWLVIEWNESTHQLYVETTWHAPNREEIANRGCES